MANLILGEELGLYRAMADGSRSRPRSWPNEPAAMRGCCASGSAPKPRAGDVEYAGKA